MEMARWCLDLQSGAIVRTPGDTPWRDMTEYDSFEVQAMRVAREAYLIYNTSMMKWTPNQFSFNDWALGLDRKRKKRAK